MARHILGPNTTVTVNGTNLSQWTSNVTMEDTADEVESTGMGMQFKEYTRGLRDATFTATFSQDYESGGPDAVLSPLYYNDTAGTVKITPNAGTVVYTLISKPYGWSPVSGGVGALNTVDVTFRASGTVGLTRGTV